MNISKIKKPLILGILFFLPVIFLLFLYPSTHNYNALDIVKENVLDISESNLENNITVLGFLGENPIDNAIMALNLKELIYDKFRGFKKFQVVLIVSEGTQEQVKLLKQELYQYEELKYWHFVYANETDIKKMFNSLSAEKGLSANLSTNNVFIIDTELNQRGRLDERTGKEKEKNAPVYGLSSYDCIRISEIKNKMSEDLRILFTEYRQKRKGTFDSASRRAEDIKPKDEQN